MFLEILSVLLIVTLVDSIVDCVCKKKDVEKERQTMLESLCKIEQQLQQKIIENTNERLPNEQKEILDNEIEKLLMHRSEVDFGIVKYEFVPDHEKIN